MTADHPKKSLGQHWLHDVKLLLPLVAEAAEVQAGDAVLEVGPGLGTLTEVLASSQGAHVTAVEFDDELARSATTVAYCATSRPEHLRRSNHAVTPVSSFPRRRESSTYDAITGGDDKNDWIPDPRKILHGAPQVGDDTLPNLTVFNEDILKFDLSTLPKDYKVCANIPYYLTSNLIRRLLESENPPAVMALLIQKEVAERIASGPGEMSILAVATQFYAEVKLCELVPAELFTPPPKVDSQIIQIKRRKTPLFPDVDTQKFFQIVRAGFSEKRKKLRSSLSGGLQITKPDADELLKKSGISPNARAQELTLEQWHNIYKVFNVVSV
jgi:16S rRNA (adenine1518-N6/adenine1519-N6)-dimethyltransferase